MTDGRTDRETDRWKHDGLDTISLDLFLNNVLVSSAVTSLIHLSK